MAYSWLSNLVRAVTGGGGGSSGAGYKAPTRQPQWFYNKEPNLQRSQQASAQRLTSLAKYYMTKSGAYGPYQGSLRGVAAVRGADRYVREGPAARQVRLNATEAARYNAAADYYRKQLGLYKGYQADANRYTGQAAAYLAEQERLARAQQAYADRYKAMQDAYYAGLNQPSPGNQYGYGYGYDYPSYDAGGGATLPDWYNSFLNQFAWRI